MLEAVSNYLYAAPRAFSSPSVAGLKSCVVKPALITAKWAEHYEMLSHDGNRFKNQLEAVAQFFSGIAIFTKLESVYTEFYAKPWGNVQGKADLCFTFYDCLSFLHARKLIDFGEWKRTFDWYGTVSGGVSGVLGVADDVNTLYTSYNTGFKDLAEKTAFKLALSLIINISSVALTVLHSPLAYDKEADEKFLRDLPPTADVKTSFTRPRLIAATTLVGALAIMGVMKAFDGAVKV